MEEIDYLISLLNTKQDVNKVQKLSQVNYNLPEDGNNKTASDLILPVLKNNFNSKTDSMKNINKIYSKVKLKPIKHSEKK
jgi:hypothetical protein